jgi:hypothetical protein
MRRYQPAERELAMSKLRSLLKKDPSYHKAAKEVKEQMPSFDLMTLRRYAHIIAVEEGYYSPTGLQHSHITEHNQIISKCKEKFENDGYVIIQDDNKIKKIVEDRGSKGHPDLCAMKSGHPDLYIEIIERTKTKVMFVNQLERYSRIKDGKVIVVLPIDTHNIELWGIQDLMKKTRKE